ncbi:hypothetical protein ACS0TY_002958 [Phlomoides rotata]
MTGFRLKADSSDISSSKSWVCDEAAILFSTLAADFGGRITWLEEAAALSEFRPISGETERRRCDGAQPTEVIRRVCNAARGKVGLQRDAQRGVRLRPAVEGRRWRSVLSRCRLKKKMTVGRIAWAGDEDSLGN